MSSAANVLGGSQAGHNRQDEVFDLARTSSIAFAGQACASLADESALQARLDAVFSGVARRDVVVCTCVDGQIAFAAVGPAGESRRTDAQVRPGCLAKLFTATLIRQLITEGALDLDDRVGALLSLPQSVSECLNGITIRHLLDHMHGLDDSACVSAPLAPDGFIDPEALIRKCAEFRLSRPGEIYSYSNAGAWIEGAILEAWHGRRYEEILRSRLFDPLGITHGLVSNGDPKSTVTGSCPATGGAIAISARDLARFLDFVGSRQEHWPDRAGAITATPLPGWNPFERGVFRGWKCYGDGWYGHNSIADDGSTVLARLHPKERISLVVASTHQHANVVAAKVLGKSLPGYSTLSIPRLSATEAIDPRRLETYAGAYRNCAEAFYVFALGPGKIELDSPSGKSVMSLAEENVFIASKADAGGVKFIQFLCQHGSSFHYLWDGRRVYRKSEVDTHV